MPKGSVAAPGPVAKSKEDESRLAQATDERNFRGAKGDRRTPVPSEASQKEITEQLDEVHHFAQIDTTAAKRHLAEELFNQAGKSADTDRRYVLLREATDLASEAGNAQLMVRAINAAAAEFKVNGLVAKEKMLVRFAGEAATAERIGSLVEASRQVAEQAAALDRYDVAVHLARQASAVRGRSRRSFPQGVRRTVARLERQYKEYQTVAEANNTLQTDPANPAANLALGRWNALVKGDWDKALEFLAKGGDPALQRAAQQEIRGPKTADSQAAAGDAWWNLEDAQDETAKSKYQARAASWYERTWPQASAALKVRIAKRLGAYIAQRRMPATSRPPTRPGSPSCWPPISAPPKQSVRRRKSSWRASNPTRRSLGRHSPSSRKPRLALRQRPRSPKTRRSKPVLSPTRQSPGRGR